MVRVFFRFLIRQIDPCSAAGRTFTPGKQKSADSKKSTFLSWTTTGRTRLLCLFSWWFFSILRHEYVMFLQKPACWKKENLPAVGQKSGMLFFSRERDNYILEIQPMRHVSGQKIPQGENPNDLAAKKPSPCVQISNLYWCVPVPL